MPLPVPPLVFILGTQRAGTTLLTRILSAHSDLFIQNEISVEQVFKGNGTVQTILNAMNQQIAKRHKLSISELLRLQEKSFWGVKDPELTQHLSKLEQFSDATKFLIIIRDGRAVVNSYMENKWGLGTNVYTGAKRWKNEVEEQTKFAQKHPQQTLIIRFEDLVNDMEITLKKVCNHLDLPFDEEMLTYNQKKAQFKENPSNINTNKTPNMEYAKSWEKKLSSRQTGLINYVAQDTLNKYAYPMLVASVKPSFLEQVYYALHQRILGEIQLQWQWRKARMKAKKKNRKQTATQA